MAYFLTMDGGGTKTHFLLFDEQFRQIGFAVGGPLNNTFETSENMRTVLAQGIRQCCGALPDSPHIRRAYLSLPGDPWWVRDVLNEFVTVEEVVPVMEGPMSLLAGIGAERGGVALAGTGSGAFWIEGSDCRNVGGWGYLLGDEGSAYDIGRQGMLAAIRAAERRGSATELGEAFVRALKLNRLWDLVDMVYSADSPRRAIALTSPIVAAVANAGDAVAAQILYDAGQNLGIQCRALFAGQAPHGDVTFTFSGSAWKGSRQMYEGLRDSLAHFAKVEIPHFEPVMGGVSAEYLRQTGQVTLDFRQIGQLKANFPDFCYKMCWAPEE